jgi:hypothetical protein
VGGEGLGGDDLTEFVRRCVLALLERGAKPVLGGKGTEYDWLLQPQYGDANEEIANTIVSGLLLVRSIPLSGVWFAFPSPYVGRKK